ncbi:MAG: DNA polymerase III subunit beta [Phycisphaerae bacterium]
MKIRLPRQELQEALQAVALLTSGRTTRPILNCVRLDVVGEELELSGTDGESGLRVKIPCLQVSKPGATVVGTDRLLQVIREFPDVEIVLTVKDRHCVLSGEGSEFKLFVQSADDFPAVPKFDGDPDLVIDARELSRIITLTAYAAARETSRYAINGVLWQKQGKRLFLVATDGRRLARAGAPLSKSDAADFEIIVPAKALQVFDKIGGHGHSEGESEVEVKVLPNQVLLRFDGKELSSALVDGHFPKYEDVLPQGNDKEVTMTATEFYSAIRRAALLTTEDSRAVRLTFGKDMLTIQSQSPEQGEARIEMPVESNTDKLEIGFNPAFLSDALKVLPYEKVTIELSESFKPGVLRGENQNDFLYVVMPVTLT